MTANNVRATPEVAYLFTDGAQLDPATRYLDAIVNKVVLLPQIHAALTGSGNPFMVQMVATVLQRSGRSFDSLASEFGGVVRDALREIKAHFAGQYTVEQLQSLPPFRIIFAGWSKTENMPLVFKVDGQVANEDFVVNASEIVSLTAPQLQPWDRENFNFADPAASGLAILRKQRSLQHGMAAGNNEQAFIIGGFAQMTTVDRDGVHTRILEHWPDVIGQTIDPKRKAAA